MSKARRNKQKRSEGARKAEGSARVAITTTPEYINFKPGPGQRKRVYKLSKTAREKWTREEVDRILKYLRVRLLVDGTRQLTPDVEYTSPFIRQVLKQILTIGTGNYLGVQIQRTKYLEGMVGDSLYSEFYYEYFSKPSLSDWYDTPTQFRKLLEKWSKCYRIRGARKFGEANKDLIRHMPNVYKTMHRGQSANGEKFGDPWNSYKTHLYLLRQKQFEDYFQWEKKSHNQTKKDRMKATERELSKTRQSLLALQALSKYNILIDERFNLSFQCNTKDELSPDGLYIWDHVLQREHIFLRVGSNSMEDPKSIWKGAMGAIDHIRHFQNKVESDKRSMTPTLPPFKLNERYHDYIRDEWNKEMELDITEGGYVDGGAHNRDSVLTVEDGEQGPHIMRGEYVLTTASVTYMFGNGCNFRGAQVLSLLQHWGHGLKFQHDHTTGKHYNLPQDREEEEIEEDEPEELL